MEQLKKILREHLKESIKAVFPIVCIIIALCFTIAPIPNSTFISFLVGAVLLIAGMSLFNLGVQTAMIQIGERIGAYITKSRKLWIVVVVSFIIGVFITVSEPDLQVLATQIPNVPNPILVFTVAVGVGIFLVTALLRMLFYIPLSRVLIGCYILVFILAAFTPPEYLAIAFDAGGVTTGPMTVPFILSLGIGVASIRSDKHANNDSFGLLGLASVGPVLAVMILGLFYTPVDGGYDTAAAADPTNSREVWQLFINPAGGLPYYIKEAALALLPVVLLFLFFQVIGIRMRLKPFLKILIGIAITFIGLVLFLTGVNVGFMPAGRDLGTLLADLDYNWILVPIGMLIGYFIVTAEPAVHVLNKQVEEISSGAIPEKAMNISMSLGLCLSLGLCMVSLLTHISIIWFLIPGYVVALTMAFFVPKIFTAIAFDSGGVASGTMTAAFVLPFATGICNHLEGSVITDAFGVLAMVAMAPLITIQIMGLFYKFRLKHTAASQAEDIANTENTYIIE